MAAENWHVDGNFFWHFLDSREQALLVVPLFSDVMPMGGGTILCEDGIQRVARHLVRASIPYLSHFYYKSTLLVGSLIGTFENYPE